MKELVFATAVVHQSPSSLLSPGAMAAARSVLELVQGEGLKQDIESTPSYSLWYRETQLAEKLGYRGR